MHIGYRSTAGSSLVDKVFHIDRVPEHLLSSLENRDVALWLRKLSTEEIANDVFALYLGLPWQLIVCEDYDIDLIKRLETVASFDDPMTRKRGFVQIIDTDPSRIELPQRCLPVYLLNGRSSGVPPEDFSSRLRRMTMLENVRRSPVRELLVVSGGDQTVPRDLVELWSSGFRSGLTFASESPNAEAELREWLEADGPAAANLLRLRPSELVADTLRRYSTAFPESRRIARMRDQRGVTYTVDVTEIDEPERPVFEQYSLIEERHLSPITPGELSEEDFVEFFRNPEASWRPYAAGLPWLRDHRVTDRLQSHLRKLDVIGSEGNCVAYIACEPGAGGTTLARALAWNCAREGYPTLIAKSLSFVPDALPIANFLNRAHALAEARQTELSSTASSDVAAVQAHRRYEAPWVIVFDSTHWQHRSSELVRFRNELERSGRPVCILAVTGPMLGLSFYNEAVFKKLALLNHAIDQNEARELGQHLNRFLRSYNKQREQSQWDQFYQAHTIRHLEGMAAFWVTLSFWIQGQYDLSETIQEWMYRVFKKHSEGADLRIAILEIAAMSAERFPLPEVVLPLSKGRWPISHRLDDSRSNLSGLGLVRVDANGEKYWALVHDILGRFLINAVFYDFSMRETLGFTHATDPEHLRFLLLRQISQKSVLGERAYRSIGEDFATAIFKIDPDHGHGSFVRIWREVLASLDAMPQSLRDTSRVFRHHVSISRRRVAKLGQAYYGVTLDDRLALLNRAIEDIQYALAFIEYTPGSESNLNLYNSLANAYFDLADVEQLRGASRDRLIELGRLANEATRKAYGENPTNSHVIETYVKNLLQQAKETEEVAIERCIEALGILFSALASSETYRAAQLAYLSDQALAVLFRRKPQELRVAEPSNAIEVLVKAWTTLAASKEQVADKSLAEVPAEDRKKALEELAHPAGRGNLQVVRLTYDLVCVDQPYAFARQLELIEQLQATDYRINAQLRLEYAILLFQTGRSSEGDKIFRNLRHLWRDSEQFIHVPSRLRWLCDIDGGGRRTVHAITGSDHSHRAMARVQEFANSLVPFRPEEHGFRDLRPGVRFVSHVSFGHNGPFLRPGTTQSAKTNGE